MLPPPHTEFIIMHLIYLDGQGALLMFTRDRTGPACPLLAARAWYNAALSSEMSVLPGDPLIKYKEWRIFTGDAELFTIDGFRYDQVCVFMGVDDWYWLFFQNEPGVRRYRGSGGKQYPHCGCCILYQFKNIIQSIQAFIENLGL